MNRCPRSRLTFGCLSGFTSMTPYWLNMRLSPSTSICRSPFVLEMNSGAAVAQHVSIGGAGGVERGAHALADRFVPWTLVLIDVDAGLVPELQLGDMRAGAIAARDEGRLFVFDGPERLARVPDALDAGRIAVRPDQH